MPGIFDLTVAARCVVDDNYAWEVWETASPLSGTERIERPADTVHISGEEVWLDTRSASGCAGACPAPNAACAPSD